MPGSARDAYDQYREVESIVMSTYKACTEADTESNGAPFTAEVGEMAVQFVTVSGIGLMSVCDVIGALPGQRARYFVS